MATTTGPPTTAAPDRSTTPGPPAPPAGLTENLVTLFGGIWLVIGLFIDGYAHSEIIDTETEDFFTPWHAIFYSGFVFTAAAIGWIILRRSRPGPMRGWIPAGYGLAAVGVAVFAAGGLGDGIWHTVFGVETGVDALLSPTHLLLFAGMALILTAPLRAFWHGPNGDGSWTSVGLAVASLTTATALVTFFFTYAFGLGDDDPQRAPFDPVTEVNEVLVELGLATAFVATMILVVPLLAVLRRTDLPIGAPAVLWTVPVLLENLAFGGTPVGVPSAIVGGLAFEITLRALRLRLGRRRAIIAATGTGVATLWTVWMAAVHATEGVAWPPELWSGQIVLCALIAITLAILAFPPERLERADAF